jgi:putative inorganic carbon (HCO3(-)) transporter
MSILAVAPAAEGAASLAVAPVVQGAAVISAAVAGAAVLLVRDPRQRAVAMLAALALCGLAVATLEGDSLGRRPAAVAAAAGAGLIAVLILAAVLTRRPGLIALLAVGALPFRVPLPLGSETASLLLPLYGVIAAGTAASAFRWLRPETTHAAITAAEQETDRRLRYVLVALAGVLVLYALQATYSTDLAQALKNVCLFYVPFAVLLRLLIDVEWTPATLRNAFWLVCGLAVVFAAVGFYEYASGHLLLSNAKVQEANDLQPYFRVNSLFFDPNIYGRFLALTMVLLAATLLWSRRRETVGLVALTLAVLWAGLVLSLSQSSFAALLGGLAVLAAMRWRYRWMLAVSAALAAAATAVVLLAPGAIEIDTRSEASLDKATSGRFDLVTGALDMARDRPVWGFGSGSFAERYREREDVRSDRVAAISHTIPLTVAAEQGLIGLAAYLALIASALALIFRGLPARVRRGPPTIADVASAAVAAAFCALVLHTLVYAAFLEDPLAWTLLAIAAALGAAQPTAEAVPEAAAEKGARPRTAAAPARLR